MEHSQERGPARIAECTGTCRHGSRRSGGSRRGDSRACLAGSSSRTTGPGEIALALGMMLRAVTEEVPVVIGLDQAQFADDASLGALRDAMESLTDTRAFLLLTAVAGDPDTPRQLIELQAQIGRALPGQVFTLEELDAKAMTDLVTAMAPWCDEPSARNRLVRRLMVETAGRPLLAVALLRSLSESIALRERAVVWPPPEETFESLLTGRSSSAGKVGRPCPNRAARCEVTDPSRLRCDRNSGPRSLHGCRPVWRCRG